MTGSGGKAGRPRPPAPLHMVATRELTAVMRQLRVASGDSTRDTADIVNQAILDLYPDAGPEPQRIGRASTPHTISGGYLLRLERGYHAMLRVPSWLADSGHGRTREAYGSRVPPWLVRAYDLAFAADGYLIDTYEWAAALQADQQHNPPRTTRYLPQHLTLGREEEFLSRGLVPLSPLARNVIREHAELLRIRHDRSSETAWRPSRDDGSGSHGDGEEAVPEGTIASPSESLTIRWVLHNTGSVPWRDRLLYRVGDARTGILTPPFVPIPDTMPGEAAEIWCALRAPDRAGTYRACLKMGWPDGTYCFPNTLLGVIVTLIVPPADLADCREPWSMA